MNHLPTNFREILKSELALRFRKNPRYSLRAFARDLQITAPRLSEILAGKKGVSRNVAQRIAKRLGLNPDEQEFFCDLVESEHARSAFSKKEAQSRLEFRRSSELGLPGKTSNLTLDSFRFIEDWYHLALLQLLKLPGTDQSISALAKTLGISVHEVENALQRMENLELLEMQDGIWKAATDWTMSGSSVPSQSVRKFHEQLLDHSKVALHERTIEERTFRSNIFSTELSRLPEIEARIKKFSTDLMEEFSTLTEKSEVVALSLQFFPLSQKNGVSS